MNELVKARLSLIPVLAEKHANHHIGRTALMKYMYFLQTLRGIPLGYNFSMYSYGPFDSDVLSDLSTAEAMNIVSATPVSFSGGYGYQIHAADNAKKIKQEAKSFLSDHKEDINWLFEKFGNLNSAELELTSTIIYVDREFSEMHLYQQKAEIVELVYAIKPHFSIEKIETSFDSLHRGKLLASVGT
ncbi:MAG: hypothetical protein ACLPXT_04430 [Terracidiphilus sp.]